MASGDIIEVDTGAPTAQPQRTLSSIFIPDPEDEIMPPAGSAPVPTRPA